MGGSDHRPHRLLCDTEVVATGEPSEIGLVGGDDRDTHPRGDSPCPTTEHERGGEVDHVGTELLELVVETIVDAGDAAVTVERHAEGLHPHDLGVVGVVVTRTRGDDQRVVPAADEMVRQPCHGGRHAVHVGQERLRDDGHSHGGDDTDPR